MDRFPFLRGYTGCFCPEWTLDRQKCHGKPTEEMALARAEKDGVPRERHAGAPLETLLLGIRPQVGRLWRHTVKTHRWNCILENLFNIHSERFLGDNVITWFKAFTLSWL